MCGIFGFLGSSVLLSELLSWFNQIQHRGPDSSKTYSSDNLFLGFHRLAINGLDEISNQPMIIDDLVLCCNGEIYNHLELALEYEIKLQTSSDCEIILHLFQKFSIEKTCQLLDGEFSFILYDTHNSTLYAARDHLGLRGFFIGSKGNDIALASEVKALGFCEAVDPFPPRTWFRSRFGASYGERGGREFNIYYSFIPRIIDNIEETILVQIRGLLTDSVRKCVTMSDRPVGFLVSGGLDSSLCVAIGVKYFKNSKDAHTFSIGLEGSPDLKHAQIVADYLGTTHHSIMFTEAEWLAEIDNTIKTIESYDVTSVRASIGHRLISIRVKETTDVKVVISGEVSDELTCGYMAFNAIENPKDLLEESVRMLDHIHEYDTLRSDRCICSAGLEGRYPFASKAFIEFYLSIPPELKIFYQHCRIEKELLRKAFDSDLLPKEILWRRKDGFSDGISNTARTTHLIMQEHFDELISDEEFTTHNFEFNPPQSKEALYYRKKFNEYYPERDNLISGPWLPNPKFYGKLTEPSGRILDNY